MTTNTRPPQRAERQERAVATVTKAGQTTAAEALVALVATGGTAAAPHATALRSPRAATSDLADAVHILCALHATAPGIVELAAEANGDDGLREWLRATDAWFAGERAALVALTAAVGPLPSTPGQAESAAAVETQRHALGTLARSDRAGCASGAGIAFLLDWSSVREVLAHAAARVGATLETPPGPSATDAAQAIAAAARSPGHDRAMLFGAQQLIAQHRGLWQLLEARASARRG